MDLQTRKLNLISYLAQLQDEDFIEKIERFILRTQESGSEIKPFTINELVSRVRQSEKDYKLGNVKSHDELEKLSANWL